MFIIGSVMVWLGAASLSESPLQASVGLFMGLLLAATAYGVLAVVEPMNRWVIRGVFVVAFLLSLPIAFGGGLFIGFPAALLGALLSEIGMWRARRARDAMRHPLLVHTARRALPLYFSALSVVITAIMFLSPFLDNVIANPIPEPLVRFSVKLVDPFIQPMLGFSIQGSIDSILVSAVEDQLPEGEKADPRLIELQIERYAEQYGIDIVGDDTVADILSKIASNQVDTYRQRTLSVGGDGSGFGYVKIGFFLSAFFLFQILALPFSWITIGFLTLVLAMLRGSKATKMRTTQAPRTQLVWRSEMGESKQEPTDVG